ncbi:rare lipoprotein A [Rhodoplanes tepidamans]|uniref:Endolytic peptidoglycan transglycosylase RlpA n=1 Tax=Rhodoplanes tepidamans TaxID=200616 RepID=A0ABT5J448_RHOTP|nr:septal ring lytic transglycosylase RlpA family protein [Rhodoplanes tepidamans]MDC7784222.1 septal ring lytic transglycosylase RlpA family protein [Rhodoplanes tepidamans]MDQ0356680.1 rare lipoprotein A [Rhodoplanes tepidamans]
MHALPRVSPAREPRWRAPLVWALGWAGLWAGLAGDPLPAAATESDIERTRTRIAAAMPDGTVPVPRPRPAAAGPAPATPLPQTAAPVPPPPRPAVQPARPILASAEAVPLPEAAATPEPVSAGPRLASLTPPSVPLPRVRPTAPAGGSVCGEGKPIRSAFYWQGTRTASGQRFDPDGYTAAHRTLPFGTRLTVKNPRTGRSVEVVVNDRGPFTKGLNLDISRGAARAIGFTGVGTVCLM